METVMLPNVANLVAVALCIGTFYNASMHNVSVWVCPPLSFLVMKRCRSWQGYRGDRYFTANTLI